MHLPPAQRQCIHLTSKNTRQEPTGLGKTQYGASGGQRKRVTRGLEMRVGDKCFNQTRVVVPMCPHRGSSPGLPANLGPHLLLNVERGYLSTSEHMVTALDAHAERDRARQKGHSETNTHTHTHTHTHTEGEERPRLRERERQTDRERETERQTEGERERERKGERHRDWQRDVCGDKQGDRSGV
jgi:hypothetical protein